MTQAYNLSQLANNLNSSGQLDATDGLVNAVPIANGGTGASSASAARTNLGVGSLGTQNANSVAITGGSITGITDLAVSDGGTGASSISGVVFGNGTSAFTAATSAQLANALGGAYGVTSVNSTAGAVTLSSLSDFNRSLAQSGYQKLPGGLIMQWGRGIIPDGVTGTLYVTFPIAFPTNFFNAQVTANFGISPTYAFEVNNTSLSGMSVYLYYQSSTQAPFYWFALGN